MKKVIVFILVVFALPISAVYANDSVYIGGDSIGIVGEYSGLYVSGTFPFEAENKKIDPANSFHIQDLIIAINEKEITSLEQFQEEVNTFQNRYNEIPVKVIRNGNKMNITMISSYRTKAQYGLYLKEKVLGVGTLTFYNPDTNRYGALGHPISNENNEYLQEGNIYESNIHSITSSSVNHAGEKSGNIDYEKRVGDIDTNSDIGIYGSYIKDISSKEKLEIAEENEIQVGPAFFYTVLENNTIEKFSIEITSLKDDLTSPKAIEFRVDDKGLLARCGGIIHGMSGSPIVQNGKIVAAITHVVLEDPKSGYAIYIKNMYGYTQK